MAFCFILKLKIILCYFLSFVFIRSTTRCHSLSLIVICCHSLLLTVIHCHSLYHSVPFVVIRCTTRCYSLSLAVIRCHSFYYSLSIVVTRCTTRLSFYKRSILLILIIKSHSDFVPHYKVYLLAVCPLTERVFIIYVIYAQ